MFLDIFAARALSAFHFSRAVPNFERTSIEEAANKRQLAAKAERFQHPSYVHPCPLPPPSSSSSDKTNHRKPCRNKHKFKAQKETFNPNQKLSILPRVLSGIQTLLYLDTTHSYQTFGQPLRQSRSTAVSITRGSHPSNSAA